MGREWPDYDIAVKNADGVTIYYNYINGGKDLKALFAGDNDWFDQNREIVSIPAEVTYMNRVRRVKSIDFDGGFSYPDTIISIPASLDTIKFRNCIIIDSISIDRKKGCKAFYFERCSLNKLYINMDRISFSNGVEKGMNKVHKMTIGKDVKTITCYKNKAYSAYSIDTLTIEDMASWCLIDIEKESNFSGTGFPLNSTKKIIYNGHSILPNLVLPRVSKVGTVFMHMTGIHYEDNEKIQSIYIPSTIKEIASLPPISDREFSIYLDNIKSWLELSCLCIKYANHYFIENKEVKDLIIPKGIRKIKDFAFHASRSIETISFPETIDTIGSYAFSSNGNISSVVLPNGLKSIKHRAFHWCGKLVSVVIPETVTEIGWEAFNCDNLSTVISCIKDPFPIDNSYPIDSRDIFSDNTLYNATLYVPKGTKNKYKTTQGWNKFVWIEEFDATDIESIQEKQHESSLFSINGTRIPKMKRGINIIKMSDGTTKKVLVK